jgi:anti-sigma regulatory factor (Ser/Thr protein kinase)
MKSLEEVLSRDVPCDLDAPGRVRQALLELESLGWVLGDVMLVASELVTNAVVHSGCLDRHLLRVRGWLWDRHIRISVTDPGLSGHDAEIGSFHRQPGGWGLRLVDQLAAKWGSERDEGYHVWAEMSLGP